MDNDDEASSPALSSHFSAELQRRTPCKRDEARGAPLQQAPTEWEVRVQRCSDVAAMPIEDGSVTWPDDHSPFIALAPLLVEPQAPLTVEPSRIADDRVAFSPCHGMAAHRPLGSLMRVRQTVYAAFSCFRSERNGCPMQEPKIDDAAALKKRLASRRALDAGRSGCSGSSA